MKFNITKVSLFVPWKPSHGELQVKCRVFLMLAKVMDVSSSGLLVSSSVCLNFFDSFLGVSHLRVCKAFLR